MVLEYYSWVPLYENLSQQHPGISHSMGSPSSTSRLFPEGQTGWLNISSMLCLFAARLKNPPRNPLCRFLCTPSASRQREPPSFKVNFLYRISVINQMFLFHCFFSNPSSINAQKKLAQYVKNLSSLILFGQNANSQLIVHLFETDPFSLTHILWFCLVEGWNTEITKISSCPNGFLQG